MRDRQLKYRAVTASNKEGELPMFDTEEAVYSYAVVLSQHEHVEIQVKSPYRGWSRL